MSVYSWEATESPGTLSGAASISAGPVDGPYDGSLVLSLFARRRPSPAPTTTTSTWSKAFAVSPGIPTSVFFYLHGTDSNTIQLRLTITDGAAVSTFTLTAPTGSGWVLWAPTVHIPVNPTITIALHTPAPTSIPGGSLGVAGTWFVDKLQLLEPVQAAILTSHLAAMDALKQALMEINGADGFRLDLGSRVFDAVIAPDDEHVQTVQLPYACLDELPASHDNLGDSIVATWEVVVMLYVAETWGDKFNSSARRDYRRFADDCRQLALQNQTLGGEVHDFSLVTTDPGTAGAMPDASFAEVTARFQITQHIGLDSLT